jgi:hypothetical protein
LIRTIYRKTIIGKKVTFDEVAVRFPKLDTVVVRAYMVTRDFIVAGQTDGYAGTVVIDFVISDCATFATAKNYAIISARAYSVTCDAVVAGITDYYTPKIIRDDIIIYNGVVATMGMEIYTTVVVCNIVPHNGVVG